MEAQVLVGIVKGQMLFKQSAHFVEVLITLQNNATANPGPDITLTEISPPGPD